MQGREHEWLFLQPEGQAEVAASCQAKRLIIVSCRRGQTYGSTLEVQQELSPMVLAALHLSSRAFAHCHIKLFQPLMPQGVWQQAVLHVLAPANKS